VHHLLPAALAPVAALPKPKKKAVNAIEAATPIVALQNDPAAETVDDDDGYGDDDFEVTACTTITALEKLLMHACRLSWQNYNDDDIEQNEDGAPKPTALVSMKRANREEANDALSSRDMSEVQQALKAENASAMERQRATDASSAEAKGGEAKGEARRGAKGRPKSPVAEAATRRPVRKYLGDLGADLGGSSLRADDPRVLRAQEIKKVVQFHQERSTMFEQASMSAYDLYLRRLRSQSKTVSQEGSQSNEDDRSVEVQTDDIETASQEAQFQFGDDDTQFANLLAAARSGLAAVMDLQHGASAFSPEASSSHGTLARFLRQSTPVIAPSAATRSSAKELSIFLPRLFSFL
jgi:hypothetical protein